MGHEGTVFFIETKAAFFNDGAEAIEQGVCIREGGARYGHNVESRPSF